GPLDKDGRIDYAVALNKRSRKGVTPANNANVLVWQALGPRPEGETMPAEFFQWLGIPEPPERGQYFIDVVPYAKDHGTIDAHKDAQEILDQLDRCGRRPWTPKDYPTIA